MIEKFKVGYWYKYTGKIEHSSWNHQMKKILDGKWRKCTKISLYKKYYAGFEDIESGWGDGCWSWAELDEFLESKYHPIKKKLRRILDEN